MPVDGARMPIAAFGSPHEALARPVDPVERLHHSVQGKTIRGCRQLEPALSASCGLEDAGPDHLVEDLAQVVPGDPGTFCQFVGPHRAPVRLSGQRDDGSERVFGGLGDHGSS